MPLLWVLKVLVGLAFIGAGGSQLAGAPAMAIFWKIGLGQGFRILTGLLTVVGAIGLWPWNSFRTYEAPGFGMLV